MPKVPPQPSAPALLDQSDPVAKAVIAAYLQSKGHFTRFSDGSDENLVSTKGGAVEAHDIEVHSSWVELWPPVYRGLYIAAGKKKLIYQFNGDIWFWVVNAKYTKAWVTHGKDVLKSPILTMKDRVRPQGVRKFAIPLKHCHLIDPLYPEISQEAS